MVNPTGGSPERRRHVRIEPKGTVILLDDDFPHGGRISNLSSGGLLASTILKAPECLLSRAIQMRLRLDGQLAEWLPVTGRVTRIETESIAISFDSLPDALVRMIDQMSGQSRAHSRVMSVVLVDADSSRRSLMASVFRAVGCNVVETATPLEVIVRLGESSFEPDLIAIANSMPSTVADDLRRFVERDHPQAKLVTIGNDVIEPSGIAHWLSSADPDSDLAARVRQVLMRP
jgi:hypothetical protein